MIAILLLILLLLNLFLAWRRQPLRSFFSLAFNAVSFAEAFLAALAAGRLYGEVISGKLAALLWQAAGLQRVTFLRKAALEKTLLYFAAAITGVLLFYAAYFLFLLINLLIKRLLFFVTVRERYGKYTPKDSENRWLCMIPGLASLFLTALALLFPIAAVARVSGEAAAECGYLLQPAATVILGDPVLEACSAAGGSALFDKITGLAGEICGTEEGTVSEELGQGLKIAFSGMNLLEGKDPEKNLSRMCSGLEDSSLWAPLFSEIAADAAYNLSRGQAFFGVKLPLPNDRRGAMLSEMLGTVSGWKEENLLSDLNTAARIFALFREYNVQLYDDAETLYAALAQEEFCESLFLELLPNEDLQAVVPILLKFGLGTALDAMGMEMREEYIVLPELAGLTEGEIRQEARAFSALLKQMAAIAAAKKQGGAGLDFLQTIEDIQKLMDSKLLSNVLLNLILQVLYGLFLG